MNLIGTEDKIIDSFVQSIDRAIIPAHGTARFRVIAETPARPGEIRKAEVFVERSRTRGRWD